MTLDDAMELVRQEHGRIRRLHGDGNKRQSAGTWIGLFAKRLGHLATAATGGNSSWFVEELAKTAATALAAMENQPDLEAPFGAEGIAEIVDVDTSFPKIKDKVIAVPDDAVRVATDVKGKVFVGNGGVWVSRVEAVQKG